MYQVFKYKLFIDLYILNGTEIILYIPPICHSCELHTYKRKSGFCKGKYEELISHTREGKIHGEKLKQC